MSKGSSNIGVGRSGGEEGWGRNGVQPDVAAAAAADLNAWGYIYIGHEGAQ